MQIEKRKNQYQHDVADCPFCNYFAYVRPVTKVSPDPLRDLKRHITNQAKNEALAWAIMPENEPAKEMPPHLKYYKEHTNESALVPKIIKRVYDADLILK